MSVDYLTLFVPAVCLTAITLAVLAIRRIRKDSAFTPDQRAAQLWLIWLLPILGAALVLAVLRDEPPPQQDRTTTSQRRA